MVKLVLTGVWVCAITLASVYFSVYMATAPAPAATDSKQSALECFRNSDCEGVCGKGKGVCSGSVCY